MLGDQHDARDKTVAELVLHEWTVRLQLKIRSGCERAGNRDEQTAMNSLLEENGSSMVFPGCAPRNILKENLCNLLLNQQQPYQVNK